MYKLQHNNDINIVMKIIRIYTCYIYIYMLYIITSQHTHRGAPLTFS